MAQTLIVIHKISSTNKKVKKLWGKNFRKFWGFVAICKSFLREIWGCGIHWRHKQAIYESFLYENIVFFTNLLKFSPLKVFRYTIIIFEVLL